MHLEIKDLSVVYGKKQVLDSVSFDIRSGESVSIIGPNGAGKTSLLRAVMGTAPIQRGSVLLDGTPTKSFKRKELAKKLAYLPQNQYTYADTDVETFITYGRYPHLKFLRGFSKDDKDAVKIAMQLTDTKCLARRELSTLSGGELQRVRLAMAVCTMPEMLILDEPTAHTDIGHQAEMMALVTKLRQELGISVLCVHHDINLAASYSDRFIVLDGGRIHSTGCPCEVMTAKLLKEVFGIDANIAAHESGKPYYIPSYPAYATGCSSKGGNSI